MRFPPERTTNPLGVGREPDLPHQHTTAADPTASKAVNAPRRGAIVRETTGKQRDRVYACHHCLEILTENAE